MFLLANTLNLGSRIEAIYHNVILADFIYDRDVSDAECAK